MSRTSASKVSATKWIIELDRHEVESAIDWSRDLFARYDTTELASIRIGRGRGRASGVYGRCTYPRAGFPYYYTEALTQEEGIIWIVAHEAFHFLRRTGQVAGRNTEIEADKFADEQLESLRRLRERWSK